MRLFKEAVGFILYLYVIVLLARVVLSYVMALSRDWKPRGLTLVLTESVFYLTDPPVKALRRVIPPLEIGGLRLDLAIMVLFLAIFLLGSVVGAL